MKTNKPRWVDTIVEIERRDKTTERIWTHYDHAKEKHPYFCDKIACVSQAGVDAHLDFFRALLRVGVRDGVEAVDVIQCELYEALQAYLHGDNAKAVEECYDTISAILRTIDVLEGRQKLGKPKEPKKQIT